MNIEPLIKRIDYTGLELAMGVLTRPPLVSTGAKGAKGAWHPRNFRTVLSGKVINVGSDTFGNPIFHEGLQN